MSSIIYHTTHENEVKAVNENGRWGSGLFFSGDIYSRTGAVGAVYAMEIDTDDLYDIERFGYSEDDYEKAGDLAEAFAAQYGLDEDDALELITDEVSASKFIEDWEVANEADWDKQAVALKIAVRLGYPGVQLRDEQGACYLIDMKGREDHWTRFDAGTSQRNIEAHFLGE